MSEAHEDPDTPTSPQPGPNKAHGDAFLDQSGSRHGTPPEEPATTEEGAQDDEA